MGAQGKTQYLGLTISGHGADGHDTTGTSQFDLDLNMEIIDNAVGTFSGAPINSPHFTGVPTVPNAAALTNNGQIANTAYVDTAVAVETARAEAVEGTLAPLSNTVLTNTLYVPVQISTGNNAPNAPNTVSSFYVNHITSAATGEYLGVDSSVAINAVGANEFFGVYGKAQIISGVAGHQTGGIFGVLGFVQNNGTATLDNGYGLFVEAGGVGAGPITNLYGLYIKQQASAAVTHPWGVYQLSTSDLNFFGGATEFHSTVTFDASPVLPTATPLTDSTIAASTAYVDNAVAAIQGTANQIAVTGTAATGIVLSLPQHIVSGGYRLITNTTGLATIEIDNTDGTQGFISGPGSSATEGLTTGNVNTSGTSVTLVTGAPFFANMAGAPITINSVVYTVQSVQSTYALTLTGTAGTQSNVAYSYSANAVVNTNGLVVSYVSGAPFNTAWIGGTTTCVINGVGYVIASVQSTTSLTLTSTAGVQTGVTFSPPGSSHAAFMHFKDAYWDGTTSQLSDWTIEAAAQGNGLKGSRLIFTHTFGNTSAVGPIAYDFGTVIPLQAGSYNMGALTTVGAVTVTAVSTGSGGNSTTWSYIVVANDNNSPVASATSPWTTDQSPTGTTAVGSSTLDASGTQQNNLSWAESPGALSYSVFRVAAGGTPSTLGYIGTTITNSFSDIGQAGQAVVGTCTTNGTVVTAVTGAFATNWPYDTQIIINGVTYAIASVASTSVLTLKTSAGVQSSAVAFTWTGVPTLNTTGILQMPVGGTIVFRSTLWMTGQPGGVLLLEAGGVDNGFTGIQLGGKSSAFPLLGRSGAIAYFRLADLSADAAVKALSFQSTIVTGTAPFTVASTTNVANLNASSLNGATFASPGAIGGTAASSALFTTIGATGLVTAKANIQLGLTGTVSGTITFEGSTSGSCTLTANAVAGTAANALVSSNNLSAPQLVSTIAIGTAPFVVTSTTQVANLQAATAGNLAAAVAVPNGTSATTQAAFDNSTKLCTTAYADAGEKGAGSTGFKEDFIAAPANSTPGSGQIVFDTAWQQHDIVSATGTIGAATGTFANPGQLTLTTGLAGSGDGIVIYKNTAAPLGNLGGNAGWEINIYFKLGQTTLCAVRAGVCAAASVTSDPPTDGMWVEYDTANASSNADFTWVTASGSVYSYATTNSIAADTNMHHIRIRSTVAGTIGFQIDGGTEFTTTTDVTTGNLVPFFEVLTRTTAAKTATFDFFSYIAATGRAN
jgi:hypothetical protein